LQVTKVFGSCALQQLGLCIRLSEIRKAGPVLAKKIRSFSAANTRGTPNWRLKSIIGAFSVESIAKQGVYKRGD
jgi:hypothetical protein